MGFELSGQGTVRVIGLGNHHHAGRFLIQPVNEPRPLFPADVGWRHAGGRKVMQQGVHQRARPIPRRRMHHEAGLLIEHQQVGVFMENLDGDGLRTQIQRLRARHLQPDTVPWLDLLARADWLAVDLNTSLPDQPLQSRTGKDRVAIGKKDVDPFGGFSPGDDDFNRSRADSIHVVTA
ncbi:MAG: hypothetical protein LZF60_160183 [Nitrospira sp.]|nr:MAG: hypothetical protein LZF60_160183 [Nitrospira sp.]